MEASITGAVIAPKRLIANAKPFVLDRIDVGNNSAMKIQVMELATDVAYLPICDTITVARVLRSIRNGTARTHAPI